MTKPNSYKEFQLEVKTSSNNHSLWKILFTSLNKFSTDYMSDRDQPKTQSRDDLF